jgi:tetratricopeptide (TPR) repeat protein
MQTDRLAGGTARLPGLGDRGRDPLADPQDDEDPLAAIPQERTLSIEEMAEVLRHGRLVESLTEGERNRVRELIEEGQSLVAKADYFKAERRFESALRMQPDHPMATAGLASAQIGAGLYLSAGLTLRKLFTDYPEMIDTRYAEGIIPSRQRLEAVAEVCRNRMTMGRDSAGYGLVVAFIGHQLEMPSLVVDGLRPMRDDETTSPLAEILEAVWLGDEEPGK